MNCLDISEKIYKYCDGEASPFERLDISQHLDTCAACQHMYQLTLIENDILGEKDDIPSLSPEFTSLVMSSLQSDVFAADIKKRRYVGFNRKLWFSSMTALAAVLVLAWYLPSLNIIESKMFHNYSFSTREQAPPSIAYDGLGPADPIKLADKSEPTAPTEISFADSENTDNSVKSTPINEQSKIQPLVLAGSESPAATKTTAAPNVSRSINSEGMVVADNSNIALRPQNIPDRLKFVQLNNDGNKTIFNYASQDGKEHLQLTLVPNTGSTIGSKTGTDQQPQEPVTLSREIQVTDKKMTVIISGNLPIEEMTTLADSLQFQDTPSD